MPIYSRTTHLVSLFSRLLAMAGLALTLAHPAHAGGPGPGGAAGSTPSLSTALNPDGTLRAGATGSFDARHFTMSTAADGRPVFRPAGATRTAGAGDDRWRDGFGAAFSSAGVRTVVQMGTDVYVGGRFAAVGSIKANNIAKWNGTSWSTLGSGTNDVVSALAVMGTDLYVGGDFVEAGGVAAKRLAKWNGSSWSALGAGLNSGTVSALAVLGTDLYVGGFFTSTIGGITAYGVAKWTPATSTWSSLGTGTSNGLLNGASVSGGSALALAVSGTDLYVGGTFTKAGTVSASNVAKWSTTTSTWSTFGAGVDDGTANSGSVNAIAVSGSNVYVGGFVSRANGTLAVNSVARWNGTTWSGMGSGLKIYLANVADARVPIYSLVVSGSNVYAAGDFNTAGGNTAIANGVAMWNGSAWSSLGTGAANGIATAAAIGGAGAGRALAVASGGGVYVGSYFARPRPVCSALWRRRQAGGGVIRQAATRSDTTGPPLDSNQLRWRPSGSGEWQNTRFQVL
ncbi:hypothetical protein MON38_05275 [Hymenobacter sp. DH14]|uniref:Bulb-type lectin domain-containing protein n=1 Tax=Hymenobacter cyanobacteriorum TaxID=2926463 RepID=A0A9X1VI57_9BACT|nr:hypothetical protein [Hymenobacter cyanobacteriorum]MCI1186821.1 hypothetical protein [Hymenobacter cyanobacteriorum]